MAAKTRFGLEGYGVRRAGSFSGKQSTEVAAPRIKTVPRGFTQENKRTNRQDAAVRRSNR